VSAVAVIVNGRSTSVNRGSTVTDLVKQLGLVANAVVIEFNGEPLLREQFPTTELEPGDAVEIAHMVGGG
jgi:thiamine biosynthesis protein ThiS